MKKIFNKLSSSFNIITILSILLILSTSIMLSACKPNSDVDVDADVQGSAGSSENQSAKTQTFNSIDITGNNSFSANLSLDDVTQKPFNIAEHIKKSGKISLVVFGYTSCPDYCPLTLIKFSNVKKILAQKNIDMNKYADIIFISVDEKRDTPKNLQTYLQTFSSSIGSNLIGLIAKESDFPELKRAFKVAVEEQSNLINHSTGIYAVDKTAAPRLYMPYNLTAEQIAADLAEIIQQTS